VIKNNSSGYCRTSADIKIKVGEKANSSSPVSAAARLVMGFSHRYRSQHEAVPASTDGIRSISSDCPSNRQ